MTVTLTTSHLILIAMQVIWLICGIATFRSATSGGGDAGFIGLIMWFFGGAVAQIFIWLLYFSGMYLFS